MLGEGLRAGLRHMGVPLRTVAFLEREAYPAACLAARIEEGSLDAAPVWSDLLTFNACAWRGAVDGIVAGFPCQDLSLAGRRAGLDGKRSGLFFNILDIAHACGAWFLFLENVAGIASAAASVMDEAEGELEERAAARVVGELAERGWNAEWLTLSASEVGASHGRERWFCFAWRNVGHAGLQHQHLQQWPEGAESAGADGSMADTECPCDRTQEQTAHCGWDAAAERPADQHSRLCGARLFAPGPTDPTWPGIIQHWPHLAPALEPSFHRVVDGLEHRMDDCRPQRLKCCGNGVVAAQAAFALVGLVRRMNEVVT